MSQIGKNSLATHGKPPAMIEWYHNLIAKGSRAIRTGGG
jgi:hypothetical protein